MREVEGSSISMNLGKLVLIFSSDLLPRIVLIFAVFIYLVSKLCTVRNKECFRIRIQNPKNTFKVNLKRFD